MRRRKLLRRDAVRGVDAHKSVPSEELTDLDIFGAPSDAVDNAWRLVELVLERTRELAREHGATLIVMDNASRNAVLTPPLRKRAKRFSNHPVLSGAHSLDRDRPEQRLAAICARLELPFVATVAAFRAHEQPTSLFLRRNGHWSVAGHAIVAAQLAPVIESVLARSPDQVKHRDQSLASRASGVAVAA